MPASPSRSPSSQKESQGERGKKKPGAAAGSDLRGWFKPGGSQSSKPKSQARGTDDEPILIDESDEDEMPVKKPMSRTQAKAAATTSKHFASSSKRAPVAVKPDPEPEPAPTRVTRASASPAKPKAAAPKPAPAPAAAPTRAAPKRKSLVESEEEDEKVPPPKKRAPPAKRALTLSDSEDDPVPTKGKGRGGAAVLDDSEDDEPKPKKPRASPAKKAPPKAKSPEKKPAPKAAPPPPAKAATKEDDDKKPKFDYRAQAARRAAGPAAPGSKDIPVGDPGALAGLTFVFTGELESLGREDAIDLCKRYFGRVTGAPSGKTSYVVVGENAGESKLTKIKALNIPTLNEDQYLDLIRTRKGKLDDKQKAALKKEEDKVLEQAKELERREAEEEKLRKRKESALKGTGIAAKKEFAPSSQLWTTKYAPKTIKEICGNKGNVEKLQGWLANWQKSFRSGFKKPGKDGMGMYRAVLISGPPGIGKTTSAHIVAQASGYSPLELNASDTRSKKLIENATNIDNTSLDGFFQGNGVTSTTVTDVDLSKRTCLIMDEVDGMSAGDRGGVGALNTLIKKTKIPIILICNDRNLPKMKPLLSTTFGMTYKRPSPQEIRSRIMSILFKEKLKIPANVVDELVKGVNSDIRQVLNMLSTFKLGKSEMDFDEGKALVKINEKNTIMTPFSITDKLCGPYMFARTSKETLADKMDLYFQDISFIPLFVQEHYLKTNPSALNNMDGPERAMKNLELISKAADSISDGDLVDRMIHGGEQHWSLLPLHAVTSAVRPASFIYGQNRANASGGWGGPSFPQWLGQNSKMGKLQRELTDIQIRMRLRVSGSRDEIRQQYMPHLAGKIVKPLMDEGSSAIEPTIETMDEYFLGKEDWDAFVELGVDTMAEDKVLKKIPTAVKTAFTRTYNKNDHPIAFHKGDMFAASRKKIAPEGPPPDNDDVFEDDAPPPDDDDADKVDADVNDYSKDKLIKAVKPKGAKVAAAAAKGAKGKKK